jgi:hypothetical protein
MLNLKAEVESSTSQFSFKRLAPGGFNLGLIGSTCTALPSEQHARASHQGLPPTKGYTPVSKETIHYVHAADKIEGSSW